MKAVIIFTGGGPVLFLTSYNSFTHPDFLAKLNGRGISKFIAHEISIEKVKQSRNTGNISMSWGMILKKKMI
jgi:hypothetical protein